LVVVLVVVVVICDCFSAPFSSIDGIRFRF
jgi:hypothetical protein